MTPKADLYKTLQMDPEAEAEIVAVAYKRLAAKYHPDVNPAPDAGRRMREINAAYEILSDPARRAGYDSQRLLAAPRGRRAAHAAAPRATKVPALMVSPRSLSFGRVRKGSVPTPTWRSASPKAAHSSGTSAPACHGSVSAPTALFSDRTTVHVTVDTTILDEGLHYAGSIVIDSVVFGVRSIPVTLTLVAAAKPVLRVSPTYLDFGEIRPGQSPKVIELSISNAGTGYLSGSLKPMQPWLSVSHMVFASKPTPIQVMACADGLEEGRTYTGEIAIDSTGGKGLLVARLDVAQEHAGAPVASRAPARDRLFLEQRLDILSAQPHLTAEQKQERNIIQYLLKHTRGGDVADMLQKGVAAAQGAEGIAWRDDEGVLRGTAQAVSVLGGLMERLHRWEEAGP